MDPTTAGRRGPEDGPLDERTVDPDPLVQFGRWYDAAAAAVEAPEAMAVPRPTPSAVPRCAWCCSSRGAPTASSSTRTTTAARATTSPPIPQAALLFYWEPLGRQVRVEGAVARTTAEESDAYYATRDLRSRIGAYASHQSRPVADRAALDAAGRPVDGRVRRPATCPGRPWWGGWRVAPARLRVLAAGPSTGSTTGVRYEPAGDGWLGPAAAALTAGRAPPGTAGRWVGMFSMADDTTVVEERTTQLLEEMDPKTVSVEEFRGRQYDLGLAWISFPEGSGGLGLPPNLQRIVDRRLAEAGATPAGHASSSG